MMQIQIFKTYPKCIFNHQKIYANPIFARKHFYDKPIYNVP